jgi:hypothetical protein
VTGNMNLETADVPLMSRSGGIPVELIDSAELAKRLNVPESRIRARTGDRATDPLPCLRFRRYVRFERGSPSLKEWLERRIQR